MTPQDEMPEDFRRELDQSLRKGLSKMMAELEPMMMNQLRERSERAEAFLEALATTPFEKNDDEWCAQALANYVTHAREFLKGEPMPEHLSKGKPA